MPFGVTNCMERGKTTFLVGIFHLLQVYRTQWGLRNEWGISYIICLFYSIVSFCVLNAFLTWEKCSLSLRWEAFVPTSGGTLENPPLSRLTHISARILEPPTLSRRLAGSPHFHIPLELRQDRRRVKHSTNCSAARRGQPLLGRTSSHISERELAVFPVSSTTSLAFL